MADLLGMLRLAQAHLKAGHAAKAIQPLEGALRIQPKNAAIHLSLGDARRACGQLQLALDSYNHCLKLNPKHTEALCRLANTYQRLNNNEQAAIAYQRALALSPSYGELACNLGMVLLELGRIAEAKDAFRHALVLKPKLAESNNGLGVALIKEGKHAEAVVALQEAIFLCPRYNEALFNLGTALQALGRRAEAVDAYRMIEQPGPLAPSVFNNMGLVLWNMRRFEEAAQAHTQAIALRPDYSEAHNNLGNDLLSLFRFDDAMACFHQALKFRPGYPAALHNLGNVYLALNRIDEALHAYRRASIDTVFPEAEYSESIALLLKGDFANGLPKYEHRWALRIAGIQPNDLASQRWHGEDAAGRTLLLYSEQGLGDTIQFARYAPLAASRGAKVILYVQPPLKELLCTLPGVDRVATSLEPIPPHDLHCPLLSLPLAFNTELGTIPSTVPYLEAPADKIIPWQERFAAHPGLKIGIVCSGNAQHHNDHNRSIPLVAFKSLAVATKSHLYLIQKEIRSSDEATLASSPEITSLAADITDFSDTAAIIASLDLIIAVDTSVVHLAGALGKPVWTLLPFPPDWRWMLDRPDSPWYPTMRLFRQTTPGNWASVLEQVVNELSNFSKPDQRDASPR